MEVSSSDVVVGEQVEDPVHLFGGDQGAEAVFGVGGNHDLHPVAHGLDIIEGLVLPAQFLGLNFL